MKTRRNTLAGLILLFLFLTLPVVPVSAAASGSSEDLSPPTATRDQLKHRGAGTNGKANVRKDRSKVHTEDDTIYDTAEEIRAMPHCKATVVDRSPCSVTLRTAKGQSFYLGGPAAKAEVGQFLNYLKDGQTYKFPKVFVKYQKQPHRRIR